MNVSAVPLLSRICPSDVYKVYKEGSNVRIDTTLLGFEQNKWVRGNKSFIFKGRRESHHFASKRHWMEKTLKIFCAWDELACQWTGMILMLLFRDFIPLCNLWIQKLHLSLGRRLDNKFDIFRNWKLSFVDPAPHILDPLPMNLVVVEVWMNFNFFLQ